MVAESLISLTVQSVGPGTGGNVHRAGGREFGGEIQHGFANLEFLNRAGGNILGGGADGLVADVQAIHFNARGTAKTTAERNRRESLLGGIEAAAVLDLHARL